MKLQKNNKLTIIVTGSVCSGKTTFAKKLAEDNDFGYVDISKLIKEKKLFDSYDQKRKCLVVDVRKLNKFLIKIIKKSKKSLVLDSHLSHYLHPKYVDICFVTKTDLKVLKKRLEKRKYSKEKIRENLDVDIFDICYNEALSLGHKVIVVSN
ncbi:MAG: AAA family ATPase [Candidatus Nanoarchaeia archaeon]|nr:AAA family ATPase [Candidatus Nanoarchaeia archaeon]